PAEGHEVGLAVPVVLDVAAEVEEVVGRPGAAGLERLVVQAHVAERDGVITLVLVEHEAPVGRRAVGDRGLRVAGGEDAVYAGLARAIGSDLRVEEVVPESESAGAHYVCAQLRDSRGGGRGLRLLER